MPTTKTTPKKRGVRTQRQGTSPKKPPQSRLRRKIEELAVGKNARVEALGYGEVFIVPSKSDLGAYYIVAQIGLKEFACSCKGFRYNPEDSCTHVKQVLAHRDKVNGGRKRGTKQNKARV